MAIEFFYYLLCIFFLKPVCWKRFMRASWHGEVVWFDNVDEWKKKIVNNEVKIELVVAVTRPIIIMVSYTNINSWNWGIYKYILISRYGFEMRKQRTGDAQCPLETNWEVSDSKFDIFKGLVSSYKQDLNTEAK